MTQYSEAVHPPTPYFSRRNCDDKLEFFQNKLGFMCVIPRDHLQKVGQRGGSTPKIQNWAPKNRSGCKLQTARSPRSERVVRSDFGSESIGDQSFVFRCLLYATCKLFWSKTLIELLKRSTEVESDSFSHSEIFLFFCCVRCVEKRLE